MLLSKVVILTFSIGILLEFIPRSQCGTANTNLRKIPVGPIVLDPTFGRYVLSWEVDRNLETVTFTAVVRTNGFVGFGISKEGTMAGADIVAAEFNADGRITFQVG